jgi:PAS domain S-box-containing protein
VTDTAVSKSAAEDLLAFAAPLTNALLLISRDGVVLAANPAGARFLRLPDHKLVGMPLRSLVDADSDRLEEQLRNWGRSRRMLPGAMTFRCGDQSTVRCRVDGSLVAQAPESQDAILIQIQPKEAAAKQFLALNSKLDELRREVIRRREMEAALENLVKGTSAITSEQFFAAFARHLAAALQVRYALLLELVDRGFLGRMRSLAFWHGHGYGQAMEVPSRASLAVDVTSTEPDLATLRHVTSHFAEFDSASTWSAEQWIGMALQGTDDRPVGLLFVIDEKPIANRERALQILNIFAARAAAELMRKRAVDAQRESDERIRLLLDSAAEPIYGIDLEGKCTFANSACVRAAGYAQVEELLGQRMHDLIHHTHPDGSRYPPEQCPICRTCRKGETVQVTNEVFWRRDGSSFPVEYISTPIRKSGRIEGAVVTFRDITERNKVDKMKNEFVSMVSHELRTPLTSIRGALGLIAGGAFGALPNQIASLIEIAHSNSQRLIHLINDILDIEKISAGRLKFEMRVQFLSPIIEKALQMNQSYADEFGVTLRYRKPERDCYVDVDGDRMLQVLSNLLSNAAKFSQTGEVVEVATELLANRVRVRVIDHGEGIPEEFQSRIFQRFSQADSSATRQKGGTGLGLSICKALVEGMHGEIGFTSKVQRGTTFYVDLPLWHDKSSSLEPLPAREGAQCVLICEDNPDVARLLQVMITERGYHADVCYDARQAREKLRANHYAALTLDLGLPDENGVTLMEELRNDVATRDLPIIVISAKLDEGRLAIDSEFPAVDWLRKPIDERHLASVIKRAVSGRETTKPRVLHVEDDNEVRKAIRCIGAEIAEFDEASSLREAAVKLARRDYDLVLLDLVLPDGSGWDVLSMLTLAGQTTPVVVLASSEAQAAETEHVAATLVKSRTSNEEFVALLSRTLG